MKARILLCVIVSALLLTVPCAFAHQQGKDPLNPNALVKFKGSS